MCAECLLSISLNQSTKQPNNPTTLKLKRILTSLLALIAFAGLWAQTGSWTHIPMAGHSIDQVQDTPETVYYLTGGYLYGYDKETSENRFYTPGTTLSESGVKFIKYNPDGKYLAVIYDSGNIDLVYDGGRVVNLPEVKDANLTTAKTINFVSFGPGRIYVATSFGIVVYDDTDHYVVESGIYNENIPAVIAIGDKLLIWCRNENSTRTVAYSPLNERHNTIDKFTKTQSAYFDGLAPYSDNSFLVTLSDKIYRVQLYPATNTLGFTVLADNTAGGKSIERYKDGFYVKGGNAFYLIDPANAAVTKEPLPKEFSSQAASFWAGPSGFWGADADGIGSYALADGSAKPVVAKFFPESSRQPHIWYAQPSADGSTLYLSECGRTDVFPNVKSSNEFRTAGTYHELFDWENFEVTPCYVREPDGTVAVNSSSRVLYDPENSGLMYVGSLFEGLTVVDDGIVAYKYGADNSPLHSYWGSQVYDMAYDNNGNLWTISWVIKDLATENPPNAPVKVLPKESLNKIRQGKYDEVSWLEPSWPSASLGWMDAKILFHSKSNKGIALNGGWGSAIIGIDTRGTTRVDDDKYFVYQGFRNQDGTIVNTVRKAWMVEDRTGKIWIGTDAGVFVVSDIDQIADGSSNYLDAIQPKVARNDGTNYADYLLSSDLVISIAVDANNRKWLGTTTSGLYCVNADGTEILEHFDKDNSPLVSNVVTMVACEPGGNNVLIGTPEGLYVYASSSAPAREDYSEIYAYPNPVRPEYDGPITINGLMDNSLVKIADPHGNVVWTTRTEGGMAVWDGRDATGRRVRTGVYMVMASQNENGSSGAVTKIVVVN